MEVIDAQIHVWEQDSPSRPWNAAFARSRAAFLDHAGAVTIERAIGAMDAVGVDKALVTPFLLYDDIDYAVEAAQRYPDRFRVVPQIDLRNAKPEQLVENYCNITDVAAIRLSFLTAQGAEHYARLREGHFDRLFAVAERLDLPVMLVVSGQVREAGVIAERYPAGRFIVDHLGIVQGPHREMPQHPFANLDDLLDLARHPNIAIKLSGAPTASSKSYPYVDLWPHLHRIVRAFGVDRIMWGSDFSRTRPLHSYAEAVGYIRYTDELSQPEKAAILGRSLRAIIGWPERAIPPSAVAAGGARLTADEQ